MMTMFLGLLICRLEVTAALTSVKNPSLWKALVQLQWKVRGKWGRKSDIVHCLLTVLHHITWQYATSFIPTYYSFARISIGVSKKQENKISRADGTKFWGKPRRTRKQELGRGHTLLSPSYLAKAKYQTPHKLNAQMGFWTSKVVLTSCLDTTGWEFSSRQ